MDAVASACRLASDRELAAALLSNVEPAVMAASWPANDAPSPTGPDDVAAAAWLDSDGTLANASDDRVVGRTCSVTDDDFSAAETYNIPVFRPHLSTSWMRPSATDGVAWSVCLNFVNATDVVLAL